jgi:DNA-binding sugar fermentation-stimulating protein
MMNVELLKIDHPRTCRIISRRNRFVVRICIDGKEHDAWINNSGRLEDFLNSPAPIGVNILSFADMLSFFDIRFM